MNLRTVVLLSALLTVCAGASAECSNPELKGQSRDAATIQKLEYAWSTAFLSGDTAFEACLLTEDFLEIRANGKINHLSDELALAETHKGKPVTNVSIPPPTVHIHGNAAVAYGVSPERLIDGKPYKSYFADYYLWADGQWHVYFSQQTLFAVS